MKRPRAGSCARGASASEPPPNGRAPRRFGPGASRRTLRIPSRCAGRSFPDRREPASGERRHLFCAPRHPGRPRGTPAYPADKPLRPSPAAIFCRLPTTRRPSWPSPTRQIGDIPPAGAHPLRRASSPGSAVHPHAPPARTIRHIRDSCSRHAPATARGAVSKVVGDHPRPPRDSNGCSASVSADTDRPARPRHGIVPASNVRSGHGGR